MHKVGIIGCGTVHGVHAEALSHTDNACVAAISGGANTVLTAVADIIPQRAQATAEKFGCDWYTDYKDLLAREDIDSVHICVPHYLHAPIAIEAMRAGKNVLTEKPMAISVADAEEIIRVSKETGKQLGVCFQNRYNKINATVKALLDSGRAGKIKGARAIVTWHRDRAYYDSAEWRGTWKYEGGGVLINQSIHTIDMLQWYMGEIDKLKAHVDTRLLGDCIEVEDTAEATVLFKSGAVLLFYATNCYSSTPNPFVELECENCTIRIEDDVRVTWSDGRIEYIQDDGKAIGDKAYWGRSHEKIIADFYRTLDEGGKFAVDGEQGITAIKIIDGIYRSSKTNEYVTI